MPSAELRSFFQKARRREVREFCLSERKVKRISRSTVKGIVMKQSGKAKRLPALGFTRRGGMQIIDKYTDYYDYVQNAEYNDKSVIYDRRGALVIGKNTDEDSHLSERSFFEMLISDVDILAGIFSKKQFSKKRENITSSVTLALYAGFHLFLFEVHYTACKLWENKARRLILKNYEIKYQGSRADYEREEGPPLMFVTYEKSYDFAKRKEIKRDMLRENLRNVNAYMVGEKELVSLKARAAGYAEYLYEVYRPFILKETFVPKYVSPEEIFRGVEEYLLYSKREKNQESEGLSDVDKAVNHGFDKKTSFRNM